ncbi:MAG: P-type conjugative transfer protein TrbL [Gammaproteobacteria bacterium]|nr:P-type conjugative transfer protein TrbL [Gammaproteobacteria bacterium]
MIPTSISTGILDQVLKEFLKALQSDYARIEMFAKGLFYYLAGIQIVMSGIWLMFKADPIEASVKTIQIFFTITVFYTLIQFGGTWMPQIINGFISVGANSSGITSLTPSAVLDQGVSIGFAIMDNFSHWGWVTHPFGSTLSCFILVIIIVLYALLAAEMVILLVKSYVLVSLSGLMFAFGANEAVRPIAMNYFKSVIGIGLQLLTFYLIMGVGVHIGHDWATLIGQAAQAHELKPFLVVLAAIIVFYMIIKNVPSFIASLTGIRSFRNDNAASVGCAMIATAMVGTRPAVRTEARGVTATQTGIQLAESSMQVGRSINHESGITLHPARGYPVTDIARQIATTQIPDSHFQSNQIEQVNL